MTNEDRALQRRFEMYDRWHRNFNGLWLASVLLAAAAGLWLSVLGKW